MDLHLRVEDNDGHDCPRTGASGDALLAWIHRSTPAAEPESAVAANGLVGSRSTGSGVVDQASCSAWLSAHGKRLRLRRSARAAQPGARSRSEAFPAL